MMKRLLELIRRGWRKPPHVILRWLARQIAAELEQPLARARARAMTKARLLSLLGADNLDNLWTLGPLGGLRRGCRRAEDHSVVARVVAPSLEG